MTQPPSSIAFYFDFISPYSYLASQLIERRPELQALTLEYKPVVFGTMLSCLGARGPGEIPARRRHGLADVLLLASHHGLPLEGPPVHPFNSIPALRSVCAVADPRARRALTGRYFRAAWAEGKDLEDPAVLRGCLEDVGVDQDPEDAASRPEQRQALKRQTQEALGAGAFGVPSFVCDGIVFFGHDRLDLLASYAAGRATISGEKLEALLARPQPRGLRALPAPDTGPH